MNTFNESVRGDKYQTTRASPKRRRIVADGKREPTIFWAASDAVRSQALRTFGETGAKLVVADRVPSIAATLGWERIGDTGYYVYVLPAS